MRWFALLSLVLFVSPQSSSAQQVPDSSYAPAIAQPAFAPGSGPRVLIDEAHHNFHTAGDRYYPFAALLRRDGFQVDASDHRFDRESLAPAKILVIANALGDRNRIRADSTDWSLPTPSAFTPEEVEAVRKWVEEDGGSLFLIADHMPMGGAAADMAAAFGLIFTHGFARDTLDTSGTMIFRRANGTLIDHPVTNGRSEAERIDSVATFTGQAFRPIDRPITRVDPILRMGPGMIQLYPETAWQFTDSTRVEPVDGWMQGAVIRFGKGRVAAFGEAAMFTAQLAGPSRQPAGMNTPVAVQNHQFLLNIVRWLAGVY